VIVKRLLRAIIGRRWAQQVAEVQPMSLNVPERPETGSLWQLQGDYYFSDDSRVIRAHTNSVAMVIDADGLIVNLLISGKRSFTDIWALYSCFKPIYTEHEINGN
jgi:hypothetical protein